jgi:hypothetical protein
VAAASVGRILSSLEIVGWLARSAPLSGKEPHANLSKGSSPKESESFWWSS